MKPHLPNTLLCILTLISTACQQTCKIVPPTQLEHADKAAAFGAAGDLQYLSSTGKLTTDYKNAVDRTFANLSDDNAALFLLLQAGNCAQIHGQPELAMELVAAAREKYRQSKDIHSSMPTSSNRLCPTELACINQSPNASEIIETFNGAVAK